MSWAGLFNLKTLVSSGVFVGGIKFDQITALNNYLLLLKQVIKSVRFCSTIL